MNFRLNLDTSVKRELGKLYIVYKIKTNFTNIVIQKDRLRIFINIKFSEVIDPKGLCKDVTDIGHWGNGDVEVFFESLEQLDDVMAIIEQAHQLQGD